jgi:four helix bundle protein
MNLSSGLADTEVKNGETGTWLDFARDCGYLKEIDHEGLGKRCESVGKMLGSMINNPASFLLK